MSERGDPKLVLRDGNAFAILNAANRAAMRAGWSKTKRERFLADAMSGDYDHLLATVGEHFDVELA